MSDDPESSNIGGKILKWVFGTLLVAACVGLLIFGICAYALRKS